MLILVEASRLTVEPRGVGEAGVVPHLVQEVAAEVEAGVVEVQHPEVMVGAAGVVGAAEVQAQVLP